MDFLDVLRKHRNDSIEAYRQRFCDEYEKFVVEYHLLLPIQEELEKAGIQSDFALSTENVNYIVLRTGGGSVEIEKDNYQLSDICGDKKFSITDKSIMLIIERIISNAAENNR